MIINKGDVNSTTYNLSSRWSGGWKIVLMVAYGILYVSLIGYFITSDRTFFYKIYYVLLFSYAFYLLIKMTYLLKQVSFDDTHLYVNEREQEVIVPLENIASIEINTLGGTYKVNMLHDEKWGKMFYFKTSLIYPLNFRKKDALVDLLRSKIQRAKSQHFSIMQREALPSDLN